MRANMAPSWATFFFYLVWIKDSPFNLHVEVNLLVFPIPRLSLGYINLLLVVSKLKENLCSATPCCLMGWFNIREGEVSCIFLNFILLAPDSLVQLR